MVKSFFVRERMFLRVPSANHHIILVLQTNLINLAEFVKICRFCSLKVWILSSSFSTLLTVIFETLGSAVFFSHGFQKISVHSGLNDFPAVLRWIPYFDLISTLSDSLNCFIVRFMKNGQFLIFPFVWNFVLCFRVFFYLAFKSIYPKNRGSMNKNLAGSLRKGYGYKIRISGTRTSFLTRTIKT